MPNMLDKLLNLYTLIAANIAAIIAAQTVGGGTLFYETGIIHIIAIMFILLSATRLAMHYYSYDAFLEKFFHACLIAMFFFAFSHVAEFFGYEVLRMEEDAIFANVINFYLLSLMIIGLGAERFLRAHDRRSPLFIWILGVGIAAASVLAGMLYVNDELISLEKPLTLAFYTAVTLAVGIFTFSRALRIGKLVSISKSFVRYMLVAIGFMILAAVPNIFYDVLEDAGLPIIQIVYLAHYAFYASLSALFLAFGTLARLGGVYKELREFLPQG